MQHCLNKDECELARWGKDAESGLSLCAKLQKFDVQASAPLTAQDSFHMMEIQDVVN